MQTKFAVIPRAAGRDKFYTQVFRILVEANREITTMHNCRRRYLNLFNNQYKEGTWKCNARQQGQLTDGHERS